MKTISISGIDLELAIALEEAAKNEEKSVNQFVLDILKQQLEIKKIPIHDDLDDLFGCWSEQEFERIQNKIAQERVIDKELWK